MKKIFIIIIFITVNFLFAQEPQDYSINRIVPPSPTSASLGKFGEQPVNLFNGIPQINIPLWTVKSRDIELPISLSYHAGGIKVQETPGWVGAGWSLNVGGVITRTVKGCADEKYDLCNNQNGNGYYWTGHNILTIPTGYYQEQSISEIEEVISLANGFWHDYEPDVFFYNYLFG